MKNEETTGGCENPELSCSNRFLENMHNMLPGSNSRPNSEHFNIKTEASLAKKHNIRRR